MGWKKKSYSFVYKEPWILCVQLEVCLTCNLNLWKLELRKKEKIAVVMYGFSANQELLICSVSVEKQL
ncbi:hypothetical protein AHAS_Ahas20G0030900 [Arachis hypogaea]